VVDAATRSMSLLSRPSSVSRTLPPTRKTRPWQASGNRFFRKAMMVSMVVIVSGFASTGNRPHLLFRLPPSDPLVLSQPDQGCAGKDEQGRDNADPAEGFPQEEDADQHSHHDIYLSDRHGVAHGGEIEAVAEGEERCHHHRAAAEDQAPVFAQLLPDER